MFYRAIQFILIAALSFLVLSCPVPSHTKSYLSIPLSELYRVCGGERLFVVYKQTISQFNVKTDGGSDVLIFMGELPTEDLWFISKSLERTKKKEEADFTIKPNQKTFQFKRWKVNILGREPATGCLWYEVVNKK